MRLPLWPVGWRCLLAVLLALDLLGSSWPSFAQGDQEPSIDVHNRDNYVQMPLKAITAQAVVDGPVAKTRITYRIENKNTERIEAVVNLHLPRKSVLTGFGYYYGDRFIPGRMYDKGEAWKIYSAVTSRGRDPGVMDRPTEQDYHAQIFPVEAGHDLTVIIEVAQMVSLDREGAHFELPLTQGNPWRRGEKFGPVAVTADVLIRDHSTGEIWDSLSSTDKPEGGPRVSREDTDDGALLHLSHTYSPSENWRVSIRRETEGLARSVFSRMVGPREGYYALSISAPRELVNPRLFLRSNPGTRQSLPTRFGDTEAYDALHVVGRYDRPQRLRVTLVSDNARPYNFTVNLSGERVRTLAENPAAALWADKRIGVLSNATRRDFQPDIIRMSQRFMVISPFTALLAIPQEELNYYRNVLAKQKVSTNTQVMGGGGGDPYIEVKAPADARKVVAVFPTGDVKELTFDTTKNAWTGRFDIPFGTPEGEYRVTVIVVHKTGERTPFVLVYKNLLSLPTATASQTTLTATRGNPVAVSVRGTGIARAVAIAPWGERIDLNPRSGTWQGRLTVPTDWRTGPGVITVVLLDGAHNRTEVTLDVDVQ